ncbi:MAG: hypothetical protein DCF20_12385 [Pseudanabaena sp.]|nr:MAG: hypothetical protein DCF20_12385 [Pseudanabaena sp.]
MSEFNHKFPQKGFKAIFDRTNHEKTFESVAKQRFQKFSWFWFERKALYIVQMSENVRKILEKIAFMSLQCVHLFGEDVGICIESVRKCPLQV